MGQTFIAKTRKCQANWDELVTLTGRCIFLHASLRGELVLLRKSFMPPHLPPSDCTDFMLRAQGEKGAGNQ